MADTSAFVGVFQFSPPRGGRRPPCTHTKTSRISILAPAWGASEWQGIVDAEARFQFSPPRGGRPAELKEEFPGINNFNSRPRVGGVSLGCVVFAHYSGISILAPAWGASTGTEALAVNCQFQFSPPRGGRPCRRGTWWGRADFNSRPRVGGVAREAMLTRLRSISILAPAWGASRT